MIVLALDLASVVGFAIDGKDGQLEYGRCRLVDAPRGHRFLMFNRWAFDQSAEADAIAYERPIFAGGIMSADTVMLTVGLAAQAEMIAAAHNIPCFPCPLGSIRKFFLGTGRPKNPKRDVMEKCRAMGFRPADHNVADSIACWHYAKAIHDASFRLETGTPLFAGGGA